MPKQKARFHPYHHRPRHICVTPLHQVSILICCRGRGRRGSSLVKVYRPLSLSLSCSPRLYSSFFIIPPFFSSLCSRTRVSSLLGSSLAHSMRARRARESERLDLRYALVFFSLRGRSIRKRVREGGRERDAKKCASFI